MALEFTTSYLEDTVALLRHYKRLGDRAMHQVADEKLFASLDGETNSIAITVKHVAGNMRSQWTNFLTTDGEKPDRNRDSEFVDPPDSRRALLALWERGWDLTFAAIEALTEQDLVRKVTIRSEPHSVLQAINRQTAHYAYHVGQIVVLAKHFSGDQWQLLTIPRDQSEAYTRQVQSGERSQR